MVSASSEWSDCVVRYCWVDKDLPAAVVLSKESRRERKARTGVHMPGVWILLVVAFTTAAVRTRAEVCISLNHA